ncbi:hypothetical protein [Lonsdalea britannica]|uniref:hypothetical protein n=1 Tax=Lonsdalea britannica TaxID=1082704 RepID=UPI00111BF2EE|nr:hypothetical protein [Lonsdalea britannica]
MRNIPLPIEDDKNNLDLIVEDKTDKYANPIRNILSRIKNSYDNYESNKLSLENLRPIGLSADQSNSILHAYNVKTKSFKAISARLFNPDLPDFDECPYCGISEPSTLDHYLPKETYPEFSVLSKNLIPICSVCNTIYKKSKFLCNNQRIFIHPYYDIFPGENFIGISIAVGNKIKINFSSVGHAGNIYFSGIFGRHFSNLNLKVRFKRKSASEICRMRASLRRAYRRRGAYQDVSSLLLSQSNDFKDSYGVNHWKVVLYLGLSRNVDFCNNGFMRDVE